MSKPELLSTIISEYLRTIPDPDLGDVVCPHEFDDDGNAIMDQAWAALIEHYAPDGRDLSLNAVVDAHDRMKGFVPAEKQREYFELSQIDEAYTEARERAAFALGLALGRRLGT